MRILIINHSEITCIGGINKVIKRLSEELVKRGHECIVVSLNPSDLKDKEVINGVHIIRINSKMAKCCYGFNFKFYKLLLKNLEKIDPDIIHVHHCRTLLSPEVLYLLKGTKYPFIFTPHYERAGHNSIAGKYLFNFYSKVTKKMYGWPLKVIANTEYTKRLLKEDLDVNLDSIMVIPNGVDKIKLNKKTKHEQPLSLLSVGVLQEKKGLQYLIPALYELNKMDVNATLTVVGEGDYKDNLKSLAKRFCVDDQIVWMDPLPEEELYQKFAESDVFFLLSREESYGIVVAEALAMGTPCIISNRSALTEFLKEPGCFGVNYPPNPKELADLIIKVYGSDVTVGPFSDKIKTWAELAEDYEKLYSDLLKGR